VTKRLGLSLSISQALGILWLVMAMFFSPTERWTSLPISDALAAESQLARQFGDGDIVNNRCIFTINSPERLYQPSGPIPEPGPLVIGCNLADCGPGTDGPGPIDLRITLTGDLAENTILEFENMTVQEAARIGVRGNARHVNGTTRFEVRSGTTVLRGFRTNPELRPPVATPHMNLNREALEAFRQAAAVDDLLANSKSSVTLVIEQFRGQVNVNVYTVRYGFQICVAPPLDPLPEPEADYVEFSNGIPQDRILILAPGRLGAGPWGCHDYGYEVYESSPKASVLVNNHLTDDGSLIKFRNGEQIFIWAPCHSEVVVYSKSNALAVVQPVTPIWTDMINDRVPVALLNPLRIPVTVWILVDDPTKSKETKLTDEIKTATTIYTNAMCGITFDDAPTIHSVNSQIPVGQQRQYLVFDPANGQTIMQAGCTNPGSGPCFYAAGSLNVYLVDYILGDIGFTSYGPGFGNCSRAQIPTCDFFGDMIFVVDSRQADTLAHEFGHTLELDGMNGLWSPENENLMFEGRRLKSSITKGQCYRANVDDFSYANTGGANPGSIRPSSSPTHGNCPRNGAYSEVCPNLSLNP
jgi:hypothetical protein